MARQIIIDIIGDSKKFTKATDEVMRATVTMEKRLDAVKRTLLQGFGLGVGVSAVDLAARGIATVTDFMGDAINVASDLGEQTSKNTVVFGKNADEVIQWARSLDSSFGLSERAALTMTGTIGNLAVSMGLSEDKASEMARGVAELAGDLASFNNADIKEVMTALQSGLVGETEPMRRFGVDLSAAAVNARALAMGLARTEKSLTQADKVQARYAILLEQTATAQGDAARTADTFAGKQRRLGAEVEDLKAKVGTFLMGAADGFLGFLGGVVDVIDGPDGATAGLRDLSKQIYAVHQAASAVSNPFEKMNKELQAWADTLKLQELNGTPESFQWMQALGPDTLRNFGAASAEAMADVRALAQAFIDTGRPFSEFAAVIRQRIAPSYNILTGAWTGAASAVTETGPAVVAVSRRVSRAMDNMQQTMNDAKEPWRQAWRQLAAWAKDPFRPDAFENWLERRASKAIQKAKEAAKNGQPDVARRWRLLAGVMRRPVLAALADTEADIQALVTALGIIQTVGKKTGTTRMGSDEKVAGRASGGPVSAGTTYLVGEKGPELVTMGGNGFVTPNHALGGGMGPNYTINVNVAPGGDLVQTGRQIVEAIRSFERRSGAVWRSA